MLYTYSNNGTQLNLFECRYALMSSIGAIGEDGALSKLLLGWTEDG